MGANKCLDAVAKVYWMCEVTDMDVEVVWYGGHRQRTDSDTLMHSASTRMVPDAVNRRPMAPGYHLEALYVVPHTVTPV